MYVANEDEHQVVVPFGVEDREEAGLPRGDRCRRGRQVEIARSGPAIGRPTWLKLPIAISFEPSGLTSISGTPIVPPQRVR